MSRQSPVKGIEVLWKQHKYYLHTSECTIRVHGLSFRAWKDLG
jgi:hypothetical protein